MVMGPDNLMPPAPEALVAVVDEWDLGGRASMQHDMTVHPDGRIYSVDMTQDQLYRLAPAIALFGASVLPVSWAGFALALLGAALLVAELHITSHGALAASGIASLAQANQSQQGVLKLLG